MTNREKSKDDHLLWTELGREHLVESPVFSMVRSRRRSPEGTESSYYLMDAPDWVNVVALTDDEEGRRCFIMVRQFRHGSMRVSLEFPGGVVDPGEDPEPAVLRELREETGYEAETLELLGSVNPNPAFMNNRCYTYLAESTRLVASLDLDHDEYIEVELVPLEDLLAGRRDEEFDHAMMHVALRFYERRRPDSNRRMKDLQSSPLPLGYGALMQGDHSK